MTLMNEAERERFLAILRTDGAFRAAVRRELLTDELLNLPQTVAVLVDTVAQQRQDFTALAQSVADFMERTVSAIQEGFAAVRGELSDLGTGVEGLRTGVEGLRTGVEGLRADTDAGFTAVNAKFDQVDAALQEIKDQLAS